LLLVSSFLLVTVLKIKIFLKFFLKLPALWELAVPTTYTAKKVETCNTRIMKNSHPDNILILSPIDLNTMHEEKNTGFEVM
jgi:hypothetical protein